MIYVALLALIVHSPLQQQILTILNSLQFSNQIKCWFFQRGENRSTRRKTSRSRVENQQTQPTYDAETVRESNPGHIGGRRALSPLRQPCSSKQRLSETSIVVIELRTSLEIFKHAYDYNTSVSELKKSLSLELLSERRNSHRLQIFLKSVYNSIALPVPPYYKLSARVTRNYSTNSFIQPSVQHDYYKYSFFPRTLKDWNSVSPEIRALNFSALCGTKLF